MSSLPATDTTLLSSELKLVRRLDQRFFALLDAIAQTGSINRAASTAGYSYKGAWMLLESAGNLVNGALIETVTGGKGGGGTRLTPAAVELLAVWRELQRRNREFLHRQEAWLNQLPALAGLLRGMSMKTSARNQFAGVISAIDTGPVTTQVTVTIASAQEMVATMTTTAANRLKLRIGGNAIALIKSSAVVLVTDFAGFALSARNQFQGTVSRLERGAVSSLVMLTLPGGASMTASLTNDALDALSLAVGQTATAVFKAYAVMVAVQQD